MSQNVKTITLSLVFLALLSVYALSATRMYLAHRAASSNTIEGLERAVRLAPGNADYSLLLARSRTLGLLDFRGGIQEYHRAMALNPYSSRGWLDLAAAYQMSGDGVRQAEAVEQAVKVDPTTPGVAWEAATYYVLQGKTERALPHYRTVLSSQPASTPAVLDVVWPATNHNVAAILGQTLPPDPEVHAQFLAFAVKQHDLTAARTAWNRILELRPAIKVGDSFPYIQALLDAHQAQDALQAWQQLASIQPGLSPYLPTADNLIVNGDFEEALLEGGLDWHIAKPNADLKIDSLEFHSGNRSLAATFEAAAYPELGVSQIIPVEPGMEYRFSVFVKADELNTAAGPRILLSDAATDERLFLSEDQRGSSAWKEISATFRVGPQTRALKLAVVRDPWQTLIKGSFHMDDFVLRRTQ